MSDGVQVGRYHENTPGDQVWSILKQHLLHPNNRVVLRRDPADREYILEFCSVDSDSSNT